MQFLAERRQQRHKREKEQAQGNTRSLSPAPAVTEAEERDEEPREEQARSDLVSEVLSQQEQNEAKPVEPVIEQVVQVSAGETN